MEWVELRESKFSQHWKTSNWIQIPNQDIVEETQVLDRELDHVYHL